MEAYLEITKEVVVRVPLKRFLTDAEEKMIKDLEMYDLPDEVIDWDEEDVYSEDHQKVVYFTKDWDIRLL